MTETKKIMLLSLIMILSVAITTADKKVGVEAEKEAAKTFVYDKIKAGNLDAESPIIKGDVKVKSYERYGSLIIAEFEIGKEQNITLITTDHLMS